MLIIGLAAFAVLVVMAIANVPHPYWTDEALILDHSRSLFTMSPIRVSLNPTYGHFFATFFATITYFVTGFVLQFVSVSFVGMRLLYLLYFLPGVLFCGLAAALLFGRRVGWMVALILLPAALLHNYIRPDAWVFSALSAGVYFWLLAERTGRMWHYLAMGIALALVAEGHLLASRYIVGFLIIFLVRYAYVILRQRRFVWWMPFRALCGGLAIVVVVYLAYRFLLYSGPIDVAVDEFRWQMSFEASLFSGSSDRIARALEVIPRQLTGYATRYPVHALLLFGGVVLGLRPKASPFLKQLALVYLLSVPVFGLTSPKPTFYYYVHELTFVALLGIGNLLDMAQRLTAVAGKTETRDASADPREHSRHDGRIGQRTGWLTLLLAATLFALFARQIVQTAGEHTVVSDLIDLGYQLDQRLPDAVQVVAGIQPYYYAMNHRTYYDIGMFQYATGPSLPTEYDRPAPDAVIYTPRIDHRRLSNLPQSLLQGDFIRQLCMTVPNTSLQAEVYVVRRLADAPYDAGCVAPSTFVLNAP